LRAMDAKVAADALFDGSVIALVAAAATVVLDLFGFVNLSVPAAFVLGSAGAFAFAAASAPAWQWIAAGALMGAIGGVAFDRGVFFPLRNRGRKAAMLPASLAGCIIVYGLLRAAFDQSAKAMPHAAAFARVARIGPVTITELQAVSVILCIVLAVLLDIAVRKTRFGNGVRAATENPLAALLMGMRIDRVPAAAMAATGAMAGAAGALSSVHAGTMIVEMPGLLLLSVLAVVVVSPVGSVGGACLTAFALAFAGGLLKAHIAWLPAYAGPIALLALVAVGLAWRHARTPVAASIAET